MREPGHQARHWGRAVTSPKGTAGRPLRERLFELSGAMSHLRAAREAGGPSGRSVRDGQSAKMAPNCGAPDVETPDVLGETVREPVVVILLPLEGR